MIRVYSVSLVAVPGHDGAAPHDKRSAVE